MCYINYKGGMVHHFARYVAPRKGCVGMGIRDSVFVTNQYDFVQRLKNYTGFDAAKIEVIVCTLTYGNPGIRNPDPALQPFIPLNDDKMAISPCLWIGIDAERNSCDLCKYEQTQPSSYLAETIEEGREDNQRAIENYCELLRH